MKTLLIILFFASFNSTIAQNYSWTKKCENEKSEAEIGVCMDASCKEATKYFELQYNNLYKKIKSDFKKAEPNSVYSDILNKYVTFLPILKKSLTDFAIALSEIEAAATIGGSGHENIKFEILLAKIESNISTIEKINTELP